MKAFIQCKGRVTFFMSRLYCWLSACHLMIFQRIFDYRKKKQKQLYSKQVFLNIYIALLVFNLRFCTQHLELVDELWEEVKPGLSSFADDPAAGAQSIQVSIIRKVLHYSCLKCEFSMKKGEKILLIRDFLNKLYTASTIITVIYFYHFLSFCCYRV